MKCNFADAFLHGYLDGELSAFRTVEFERHMLHCADCGAELVAQDFLRGRLQVAQLYHFAALFHPQREFSFAWPKPFIPISRNRKDR